MKESIQKIKTRFIEIKSIIGDDFSINHLDDSAFVSKLSQKVEAAYLELNSGMCEEVAMCTTCAQNRDNLYEIMEILSDLDAGATITDSIGDHFIAYSLEVNEVIKRIDEVIAKI